MKKIFSNYQENNTKKSNNPICENLNKNTRKLVGRKLAQPLLTTIRQYLSKILKYILIGIEIQFLET